MRQNRKNGSPLRIRIGLAFLAALLATSPMTSNAQSPEQGGSWAAPRSASIPGGEITFELPEVPEQIPQTAPPAAGRHSAAQISTTSTGDLVRQTDFEQPVAEIQDPQRATLASHFPGGDVDQLVDSITGKEGVSGQIQSTFSKIDLPKVAGSLAIVLGAYFAFVWVTRMLNGGRSGGLPQEVVEVLGATPFGPKKQLQLVRLGSKLLLLLHSPEGTTTIGEISDPNEVDYLTGLCQGRKMNRSGAAPVRRTAPQPIAPTSPPPPATPHSTQKERLPEVTFPSQELENVVRQLATAAKTNGGNVFEA